MVLRFKWAGMEKEGDGDEVQGCTKGEGRGIKQASKKGRASSKEERERA